MSDLSLKASNRQIAAAGLERVQALLDNPDFAWFADEVLEGARKNEQARALDLNRTADERTASCHRLALAQDLCDALEKRRRLYAEQLERA